MKQAERVAKTKASLVEAFWKLYRQKPLDQISVREITDAAGVYRSTFYLYFQDAATVLAQLEDELEGRLAKLLETAPAKSALEDIPALMALFYKKEGSYLYPLLGSDGDRAFAERVFGLVRPAIKEASELCDRDFEMAFRFVCEGSLGLIASCYKQRRKTPLEDVAETGRMIIAGITGTQQPNGLTQCADEPKTASLNDEHAKIEPDSESSESDSSGEVNAEAEQIAAKPARKGKKASPKPKPKPAPKPAPPVGQPEDDDIQMALF